MVTTTPLTPRVDPRQLNLITRLNKHSKLKIFRLEYNVEVCLILQEHSFHHTDPKIMSNLCTINLRNYVLDYLFSNF